MFGSDWLEASDEHQTFIFVNVALVSNTDPGYNPTDSVSFWHYQNTVAQ